MPRTTTPTQGQGFGGSSTPKPETQPVAPIETQGSEQAKAIAQQTAQGLEQYLGHTGIGVLNQVRGAKHQITDAVSTAIAEELVPGRIQAEVLTATMGKLQKLDPSCTEGFSWAYVPELQQPSALPVVDISHLFPASARQTSQPAIAPSQQQMSSKPDEKKN